MIMGKANESLHENSILQDQDADSVQYLTFMLANEEYGIDILRVQEIKGWETATAIPNAPGYILGVINLRGKVIPIVDLRTLFQLPSIEYGSSTVVIVVKVEYEGHSRTVGMVVDAVSEVYNISESMEQATPDFGGIVNVEFVKGLTTVDGNMIILLDIDKLINIGALNLEKE